MTRGRCSIDYLYTAFRNLYMFKEPEKIVKEVSLDSLTLENVGFFKESNEILLAGSSSIS